MNEKLSAGVKSLNEEHFIECSVWRDDRDLDLYFPVYSPDEMPEDVRDLIIRVEFFTPNGMTFKGCIKGIDKGINTLLVIWIFHEKMKYGFNRNLPKLCHEELDKLVSELPQGIPKSDDDFFPLRYETRFNWEDSGYKNFWGEFDAFQKERQTSISLT
jgi:hypothetical protein